MDFRKTIIKGYRESDTAADYFVRMAKTAKELDFTLEDFFYECRKVLNDYSLTLMGVWFEHLDMWDKVITTTEKAIESGQTHGNVVKDGNGDVKFDSEGTYSLTDFLERAKRKKSRLDEKYEKYVYAFEVDEDGKETKEQHSDNVIINDYVLEKLENDLEKAKWLLKRTNEVDKEHNQATKPTSSNEVQSEQETAITNKAQYSIYDNNDKLFQIYEFCIDRKDSYHKYKEEKVFSEIDVSLQTFYEAVSSANFKSIYDMKTTKKGKCKYIIYILSHHFEGDWYKTAAESINTAPNRCSGANVPDTWKYNADKYKK